MTFRADVYAVDGNQIDAVLLRLMNQAASIGAQGVVGHLDCRVQATSPATSGIQITTGGVVILGQEVALQGSYTSWNNGLDTTLSIGATGGSPRSDMIVARAEDPTFSGSPWGGSPGAQIVFPRVLTNVGSGATQPPGGTSAIPLARIDMPSSTSTVQGSYITDLRTVANPQVSTGILYAAGPGSPTDWTVSTTPHQWPPGASWSVQIPSSATSMIVSYQIVGVVYDSTHTARGFINPQFGASITSPVLTFSQVIVSVPSTSPNGRLTIGGAAQAAIPASLRGTTQTLKLAQVTDGTNTGTVAVGEDGGTALTYQFQQLAASA